MDPFTALLLLTASYLITLSMMPKQQPPEPAAFEDIDIPQFEEGTPQCVVFGDCWIPDWTVMAVGNYEAEQFTMSGGGGKK